MSRKLYLVYGNTWLGGYGIDIYIFGLFTSKEMAEKVKTQKEDEYFEIDQKSRFPELYNRSEIEFCIKELYVDTVCDEYLGEYV